MSNQSFIPSEHQRRIFEFAANGTGSAIVVAVAGAGKTTTLVEMFKLIVVRVLMLAFNKTIADELKQRVPSHVQSATFHSVGFSAWQRYVGGKVQVDPSKVSQIMRDFLSPRDSSLYGSFVKKMVSLAKSAGMGFLMPDAEANWIELAQHFDITPDAEGARIEKGIELARAVLAQSIKEARTVIDYDDMLFMPLIENVTFPKFPVVCIDEAQDTNGVQRALLKRMLEQPDGRLIAVGDPKQAIYGFRGADSSAMDLIRQEFGCVELPLTVSFRCPQEVVKKAQEIVPYIQASEKAPVGSVSVNPGRTEEGKFIAQELRPNDAIICRNAAPLMTLAYDLIGKRIGCQILGRDIGKGLVELVKKMNAKGIDALLEKLADYERREVDKFMAKDQAAKAEAIHDKIECIVICVNNLDENNRTIPGLVSGIEALFSDGQNSVVTLCTVHKAKGLEWERVYILDADKLMPSKWAKQDWQKEQELNLMYVAYTRAKLELAFVDSDHLMDRLQPNTNGNGHKAAPVAQEAPPQAVPVVHGTNGKINVDDFVEVVRGRKVPVGTKGKVVKCLGEPWFGIIIKDAQGRTHMSYTKNVERREPEKASSI